MAPGPDPSFGVVGEGAGLLAREGKGAPGERRIRRTALDKAPECPHPAGPRLGGRKRGLGSSLRRWPTRLPARTAVPP